MQWTLLDTKVLWFHILLQSVLVTCNFSEICSLVSFVSFPSALHNDTHFCWIEGSIGWHIFAQKSVKMVGRIVDTKCSLFFWRVVLKIKYDAIQVPRSKPSTVDILSLNLTPPPTTLAQLLKETDIGSEFLFVWRNIFLYYRESKISTKLFCITKYLVKENHVGMLLSAINCFFVDFHDAVVCTSCVYLFFWQTMCKCISHDLII